MWMDWIDRRAWLRCLLAFLVVGACLTGLAACAGVEKRPGLLDAVLRPRDIDVTMAAYTFAEPAETAAAHDPAAVAAALLAAETDVIAFIGASRGQLDDLASRLPGFTVIGSGSVDGIAAGPHNAVAVRAARFAVVDEATFWLSDTPQTPGSATWGNARPRTCTIVRVIERSRSRPLTIAATQLDSASPRARDLAVQAIARRITSLSPEGTPAVLMADLAMPLTTPASRLLLGRMRPALEPLEWPVTAGADPLRDFRPLSAAATSATTTILIPSAATAKPARSIPDAPSGLLITRASIPG
ncbi:MAG: hypothetical protein ACK5XO_09585 [Phycisphaerales bacterium]